MVQPRPTTNRIVTTTIIGIAQILTVFRVYLRGRSKRLWLAAISFTCTLWAARMSCIFSVIRLIPPLFKLRQVSEWTAVWTAVVFLFMWIGTVAQTTYVCASDRSWYQLARPQCHLGLDVAIVELTTDLFADVALAVIPIRLLQGAGLSTDKRRMLYAMFGASLLTSLVSIIHAVYLLGPSALFEGITAEAEAATALMVANLGVLSPYAYRLMKNGHDFDNKPYTYYHSFQSNGGIQMRRMPRLLGRSNKSTIRVHVATPEAELAVTTKSGSSSIKESEVQSKPSSLSSTNV
ncbi:hypothetical protein BT96DRAFT_922517 [Gymnopus androsaceus JB14]|uniref:Rhodopsin domain-containing protein n=1 Tax=Gymnopus androsaceus JB14 TaxID=1447944 RepID=A0A6A4HCA5_9AGAR|nr:hypothetical protein BT96DRAFT_922517 [Gymnopus androsaceus JB14]